jgi:PAS domain S-box-containing protein
MKKKNIGIQEFLTRHMVFIAFIMFGLLLFIWVINEYFVFSSETKLLKERYEDAQKTMLKNEVNNVVNYIDYMKEQTERRLKTELQGRVNEAIDIARNIYQENIDSKPLFEIEKMVKDALRPIRFLNGRGYFFAFSMNGIETLFADRPEMEGKNMLPVQGAKGEYVVRDMIDLVKKKREGFYQYTWTKPFHEKMGFLKIAYVKYFKPFDWVFGTGEYLDDFTNQIQNMVLERIVGLRFSDEGYFFGSMEGGYPLFTNGKMTTGTDRIWEMADPNGVKIIQEQQRVSKHPDGGFVRYSWPKLGSSMPVSKISYVREVTQWGWTIGAGVYLDTVEKIIAKTKDTLKRELIKKSITSIGVFIGFIGLIWFWAKRVASKTQETIETFETSFKKAATASVTIPVSDMQFSELRRIAESANKMIDVQKKTEKSLRESESQYRILFETMTQGVVHQNAEGQIISANPSAEKILGLSIDQMDRRTLVDPRWKCIHEDGSEFMGETHPSMVALSTGQIVKNVVMGVFNPQDENCRWININAVPQFNEGESNPCQVYTTFEDITERKKAEEALRDSEEKFRNIAESSLVGVYIIHDGFFIYVNPKFADIFGYAVEECLDHMHFHQLVHPDDFETVLKQVRKREPGETESINYAFRGIKKDGRTIHIEIYGSSILLGGKTCVTGTILDITERKELERRLQQSQKLESIGNLAGGIAHDFNNVLSSIIGFTELAIDDVPRGTTLEDNLQEVFSAGKRAKDLVKQILAFARQSDEKRKPIQVKRVASEVLKMIRSTIPTTIEVKENLKSNSLVMGNPSQLQQIFLNLCTNSAQAMEKTGGILEVELTDVEFKEKSSMSIADLHPGEYIKITVSDSGLGISSDIIDFIFDPYFTTKQVGEGTGMGLAMVHGIVESYGGKIFVDSKSGEGAVFSVYLPITKKYIDIEAYEKEELPSGVERILFVDDEISIAKMGGQLIERLGYKVTLRTSSIEALELFRSKPDAFDLVITDMTMPNMTGDELAMELIAFRSDIPVILCTGYSNKITEEKAANIGIKAFAYKPVVKADLAKTIRKVLDAAKV